MKTLDEIKSALNELSGPLAERYGIAVVGIFGSRARGEAEAGSDLDLLAETLRPISLLDLTGAELFLSDMLGIKTDLVLKRSLRKELKENILRETIAVAI